MTVKQSKDAYETLVESLPFWKGALASCSDQGLSAGETQELLVKCAQVDPILEAELIQLKQANWFTEGLANAGRGIGGAFETVAGGIGGVGAGIWGVGEAATDALGITDDTTNTGFDTAGTMFQGAGAGIKNVGRSVGVEGLDAAADHGAKNYFTDVHEDTMNRAGYTAAQKNRSRNVLEGGRFSGELAATLGLGSVVASGARGAQAAGAGGRVAGFGSGAMTGIRGSAPTLVGGASPFAPVTGARLALLQQPGARLLHFGARNSVLPMTGLPGAAGYGGTLAQSTGIPFLAEGAGMTLRGGGRLIGSQGLRTAGTALGRLTPGLSPALPSALGLEAALQTTDAVINKPLARAIDPGGTHTPSDYSDETGFNAYAAMPMRNRPTLSDGKEIKLPGRETWVEGLTRAQTDPQYTPSDAFKDSLHEFQRNGGAAISHSPYFETARDRSLGHVLPFNLQNVAYPDQSPPTIELNDPAAALDFVSGPVEGYVGLMTAEESKAMLAEKLGRLGWQGTITTQMNTEFLAGPQGQQMLTRNRIQLLDMLKGQMDPTQHQSLLDVYSGQGVSMQLSDVPEVHIPAPEPPKQPQYDPRLGLGF